MADGLCIGCHETVSRSVLDGKPCKDIISHPNIHRICFNVGHFTACKIKHVLTRAKKLEKAQKSPKLEKAQSPRASKAEGSGFGPQTQPESPRA